MKKKIIQWLIGLGLALWGLATCGCGVGIVMTFINMMNSVGKESAGWFVLFVIVLSAFIFSPYAFFHVMKDGVKDNFK